ncbi:hypothetical protein LCGC14_2370870 [marine sediment metagenome]|uniref:Uncharacterized protein n=1 Tax=marine sediment metagenome TaxID=412755 RepID=A0A0F9EGB8_9ZZZZ
MRHNLNEASQELLDRLDKFIDRRIPDDGPDWEFTKLNDAMQEVKNAIKEESNAA